MIQAHYQQYLQLQQTNQMQLSGGSTGQHYYQIQQKNSLNSNNFHSSDMSLSQSSGGGENFSRGSSASKVENKLKSS